MNATNFGDLLYANSHKVNNPPEGLVIGNQINGYFITQGAEENFNHAVTHCLASISAKQNFSGHIHCLSIKSFIKKNAHLYCKKKNEEVGQFFSLYPIRIKIQLFFCKAGNLYPC